MRKIIGLLVFMLIANSTFAAEPIATLEPLLSKKQFEAKEDADSWFYDVILKYYKTSLIYTTQIKLLGAEPVVELQDPSLESIDDEEYNTMLYYYRAAEKLRNQIFALDESADNVRMSELKAKILKLEKENLELRDESFLNAINADKKDFYERRYTESLKKLEQLKYDIDSNFADYYNSTIEAYRTMQNINNKVYSVFSVTLGANHFFYDNAALDAYLSPGIGINFNPGKIFGLGRLIDIWADYYMLRTDLILQNRTTENSTSKYSLGVNLNIPLDEVFKIKDFTAAFKVGVGYFHTNTECKNFSSSTYSSNGTVIKLEMDIDNFNKFFPFGIFAGIDFNKYNKSLIFNGITNLNLNKPWVTSINVGLRFPLWQNLKDLP